MGRLYIPIDLTDKQEKEFRKKAFEKYEGRKGFLKKAATDAFISWIGNDDTEK